MRFRIVSGWLFCEFEGEADLNFIGGAARKVVRGMDSIVAGPGGRGMGMRVGLMTGVGRGLSNLLDRPFPNRLRVADAVEEDGFRPLALNPRFFPHLPL